MSEHNIFVACRMHTVDLERVRSALVHEHAAKQRDHEQRLRSVQLERQAVFQQAFQDDLQSYRTLGTIPSRCS